MNKRERMEVILKIKQTIRNIEDISEITGETFPLERKLYVMLFELTDLSACIAQAGGRREQ